MWKRRLARTPVRSSCTSSGWTSARPLTGAIEIRVTVAIALMLRAGLDLDLVPLQLEDVEVAAGDVDGHVVDRHRSDRALEAAEVGVAVEDEVGTVLRDRDCETLAAEVRPDPLRLAVQRVGRRRVM